MLVDVVVVLEVPVTVVQVIDMVVMRHLLAVVVLGMRRAVVLMEFCLWVPLAAVDVIDVIAMCDSLVTVTGQMFVIAGFCVLLGCHRCSFDNERTLKVESNDNHCHLVDFGGTERGFRSDSRSAACEVPESGLHLSAAADSATSRCPYVDGRGETTVVS